MQDRIFITNLQLSALIGCLPEEQSKKQPLILDVVLYTDIRAAGKSDDLTKTINYAEVADCIADHVKNNQYKLVETLSEQLASVILERFSVSQVTIKIAKPEAISMAQCAGVEITRRNIS